MNMINTSNDAFSAKDVPFEGLEDDGPILGGQNTSKTENFGTQIGISGQHF